LNIRDENDGLGKKSDRFGPSVCAILTVRTRGLAGWRLHIQERMKTCAGCAAALSHRETIGISHPGTRAGKVTRAAHDPESKNENATG
jgi:hypothetical protein